jgi:hypothetical protein
MDYFVITNNVLKRRTILKFTVGLLPNRTSRKDKKRTIANERQINHLESKLRRENINKEENGT